MISNKKIVSLFSIIFLSKLIAAILFPVVADEAYYYIWSKNLQLSYFDHPPMVGWLISLFSHLSSHNDPLILRLPFILLSTTTLGLWLYIGKMQKISQEQSFWFLIFCALNPLTGLGSIIATPDVPLVFFWTLSLVFFLKLFAPNQKKLIWYACLGVSLGLGFCSKYHIVLFLISGLVYLFVSKKWKELQPKGILLTILFGGLCSLPVLIWNYQNEWASFLFQMKHGFGKSHYDWRWTINYFVGQFFLISPLVFISLFKKPKTDVHRTFALSHLAFFITSSFKAIVEANWPISSHAHAQFVAAQSLSKKQKISTVVYWVVLYAILIGLIYLGVLDKTLKNQYRSTQLDQIVEVVSDKRPLYGPSYQISSLLSWRLNEDIPKLKGLARFDFYEGLSISVPTANVFYVLKHDDSIWPDAYQKYRKTLIHDFSDLNIELYKFEYE